MKKEFLFLIMCLSLVGCASPSGIGTGLGAIGGAFGGNEIKEGDPLYIAGGAALGAVGGWAAGKAIESGRNKAEKAAYDLGRSDAVKQQYWVVQNYQKQMSQFKHRGRTKLLPVEVAGTNVNGVNLKSHVVYVRVEE